MSTTEFIAHVRIEGYIEEEISLDELTEILNTRVVTYFSDEHPQIEGNVSIMEIDSVHMEVDS